MWQKNDSVSNANAGNDSIKDDVINDVKVKLESVNAILNDNNDIPEELLKKMADYDSPIDGFDFDTAEEFLLYHSRVGNLTVVDKLLVLMNKNEIELNINCKGQSKSNYGWTPLHLACYFGHSNVVEELLKYNPDVNVVNESGDTPLHKAAYTGRDELVITLLSHNANVFIVNGDGLTPREIASKESVRKILLAAEDADMKRKEEKFLSSARNGDIDTMKCLLSDMTHPTDINCRDDSGNSALHCAAYRGQKEVAVFLLKNGIDASIKNNRNQIAANLAPNIQMKQLLHEVQPLPAHVVNLKKAANRFEGPLLKKGRFLGWRPIWALLERGVFSFFSNRADATTGTRRKGYKYLESSIVEMSDRDDSVFIVYFSDRSRTMLSLPNAIPSQVDRQKWINAFNDHIYYGTNFIRQGMRLDDSDDDEMNDMIPIASMQSMIQTAQAHHSILEKHINAFVQLINEINWNDKQQLTGSATNPNTTSSDDTRIVQQLNDLNPNDLIESLKSSLPSFKFHLNLIDESSSNAASSLSHCITVLQHQDNLRQLQLRQEQEKVRVLEEALHVLAREHHDLERSLINSVPFNNNSNSKLVNHSSPRTHSICMSDTDADEYFDAFDDANDSDDKTLTEGSFNDPEHEFSDATITTDYHTPESSIRDSHRRVNQRNDGISKYGRTRLPSVMVPRDEVSLWSILKHCIGRELSKITFPVVFNEPLSFLQRICECMEYGHYLNIADQCDDPIERMENVVAYAVSGLSSNAQRMNKPFNPLLGETYEHERHDIGTSMVCEQVSHHPPVSAWNAESSHFHVHGTIHPKLKFWGKSIEVRPEGTTTLMLKAHNEIYTWKTVNCCVHNIIVGKLWFEQYGTMEITNHTNGLKASLNFKAAGWWGKDLHRLDGFIINKENERCRFIYGKWTDYIKSANVDDYEDYMKAHAQRFRVPDRPVTNNGSPNTPRKMMSKLNSLTRQFTGSSSIDAANVDISVDDSSSLPPDVGNGDIPKSDSSHSLDIPNSRILWHVDPRPDDSSQYYNFTQYSMALNQMDENLTKIIPLTDSRLRPDVRRLEEGDIDGAAAEKNRLEEKQREVRRQRKKRRDSYEPLWFKMEKNPFTKDDDWIYKGGYWDRNYSNSNDLF